MSLMIDFRETERILWQNEIFASSLLDGEDIQESPDSDDDDADDDDGD